MIYWIKLTKSSEFAFTTSQITEGHRTWLLCCDLWQYFVSQSSCPNSSLAFVVQHVSVASSWSKSTSHYFFLRLTTSSPSLLGVKEEQESEQMCPCSTAHTHKLATPSPPPPPLSVQTLFSYANLNIFLGQLCNHQRRPPRLPFAEQFKFLIFHLIYMGHHWANLTMPKSCFDFFLKEISLIVIPSPCFLPFPHLTPCSYLS